MHWSSLALLAVLFTNAGCITPVAIDDGTLRVGLFLVDEGIVEQHVIRRRTAGVGVSLGQRGAAMGFISNEAYFVPLNEGPFVEELPWGWVAVGEATASSTVKALLSPKSKP